MGECLLSAWRVSILQPYPKLAQVRELELQSHPMFVVQTSPSTRKTLSWLMTFLWWNSEGQIGPHSSSHYLYHSSTKEPQLKLGLHCAKNSTKRTKPTEGQPLPQRAYSLINQGKYASLHFIDGEVRCREIKWFAEGHRAELWIDCRSWEWPFFLFFSFLRKVKSPLAFAKRTEIKGPQMMSAFYINVAMCKFHWLKRTLYTCTERRYPSYTFNKRRTKALNGLQLKHSG